MSSFSIHRLLVPPLYPHGHQYKRYSTCPADACTAMYHNGWLGALPFGPCSQAADSQALLVSDHSQKVNEGSC